MIGVWTGGSLHREIRLANWLGVAQAANFGINQISATDVRIDALDIANASSINCRSVHPHLGLGHRHIIGDIDDRLGDGTQIGKFNNSGNVDIIRDDVEPRNAASLICAALEQKADNADVARIAA
jgi:hypothetical protein